VEVENGTKSIHLLSTNFSYWVWHAWLIVISEALSLLSDTHCTLTKICLKDLKPKIQRFAHAFAV